MSNWDVDWERMSPQIKYMRLRYGRKYWSQIPARIRVKRMDNLSTDFSPTVYRHNISRLYAILELYKDHPLCMRAPWKDIDPRRSGRLKRDNH